MIKLSQFEAFNAVMRTGSMTAAAAMLHTSQPNISRAISKLETESGLKLFERTPGKLIPTADGLALFHEVQRSFVGLNELTEAAHRIHRSGSGILRIGAIQTLSLSLIPRALKRFTDTFPQVQISVQTAHSDVLSRWVREHSCDLAIISNIYSHEGLDSETLYSVEGVCIMHESHALGAKEVITPKDLVGERFITYPKGDPPRAVMDRILQDAGANVSRVIETSYSSITCSLVMQNVGLAIVNPFVARECLQNGVIARPFRPAPRHDAIMIFPAGKPVGRPVEGIIDILRTQVDDDLNATDDWLKPNH